MKFLLYKNNNIKIKLFLFTYMYILIRQLVDLRWPVMAHTNIYEKNN